MSNLVNSLDYCHIPLSFIHLSTSFTAHHSEFYLNSRYLALVHLLLYIKDY